MGIFDGCLLATDIDGTLVVNDEINPRVLERVRYFSQEGGIFALSTGRSLGAVSSVLRRISGIGPSVFCNGCVIYDCTKRQMLFEVRVSDVLKERVAEIYKQFPETGIELHSGEKVLVLRRSMEVDDHERYERLDAENVDLKTALKTPWNKALFVNDYATDIDNFLPLQKPDDDFIFTHTTAMIDGRTRHYCELIPKGINKASSTRKLRDLLRIRPGGYFAIGDYYNDEPMIVDADIGAVTSDAPADLRAKADFVAGTAASGAVADFIDHLERIFQKR